VEQFDKGKLKTACEWIEQIAEGRNPVTHEALEEDSIWNDPAVIRNMYFIRDVMGGVLSNGGTIGRRAPREGKEIIPIGQLIGQFVYREDKTISKVINQVYEPVADRNVKKIAVTTVTGWLKAAGFLCERPAPDKQGTISIPTEKGLRLGIRPEERSFNGRTYTAVIYDQSAQEYVVNCLEMIENGEVPA